MKPLEVVTWFTVSVIGCALTVRKTHATEFDSQVRPVLASRCYSCHGPDEQEAGLRLDQREAALAKLDSGEHAINPGRPAESTILERITSTDDDLRMPPEGKPLSAAEVTTIRQWIEEGAQWNAHWSFQQLQRPQVPHQSQGHPIDAFVLQRLSARDLKMAPTADRVALARRAYYDLTGLPPSPAEVDEFLSDSSRDAFRSLVERLLDSPRYGEKWGRHWLDLVRFAETNSFERDDPKPHAWRYRDYVIRSFNDDKPYDQFVREQLAGDEMSGAGADQLIATGYFRLGPWDDEPSDRIQAKYDVLDDIVKTTGQVFLGLTIDCARCHDHKIDPIPQRDYYRMLSFFHNITPMQTRGNNIERRITISAEREKEYQTKLAEYEKLLELARAEVEMLETRFREVLRARRSQHVTAGDIEDLTYRFYRDTWEKLPDFDNLKPEDVGQLPGGRLDISPRTRQDSFGFVFEGNLKVAEDGEYTFYVDADDGVRLMLEGREVLKYDGIHGLGSERQVRVKLKKGLVPLRLDYFQASGALGLRVAWSGVGFSRRTLTANTEQEEIDISRLIRREGKKLWGEDATREYQQAARRLSDLKRNRITGDMALCVSEHGRDGPDTFVLVRGSAHAPGEKVEPGFPSILGAVDPQILAAPAGVDSCGRRTALANWIASPTNQLTARVMVNRIWQHHFGRGLVRSANNFGLLGTPPTHPKLLDWLALEFVESGWSIKAMHRLIMNSKTYQMSSRGNPNGLAKDPSNNLFWRFDMRRLTAEEIRDSILAVNGKLNFTMFGPGIYPEIPREVMQGQSRPGYGWGKSTSEEQSRRSVYIHVKRSLLTPVLESFDAADPDNSCPVRFATTQPTQALTLLNGDFIQQEAEAFATRLEREEPGNRSAQIELGLRLVTGRQPTADESARARDFLDRLNADGNELKFFCLFALNLNEFIYLD